MRVGVLPLYSKIPATSVQHVSTPCFSPAPFCLVSSSSIVFVHLVLPEPSQTRMHWLQTEEDGSYSLQSLQLDIVGFLAILGEGSVLANAQVSTLSKWIFLPRLIPAPQAMMRPSRPLELEPVKGDVSGVWSGNDRGNINFIGNIIW